MRLKFLVLCLFLFFSLSLWAQEKILTGFDPVEDVLSENYHAGPYLIYDCQAKHWVCVMEDFYQECQTKRVRDIASGAKNHQCAPIGHFSSKRSCFQRQLFLTTHNFGQRFCIVDEMKQKELI